MRDQMGDRRVRGPGRLSGAMLGAPLWMLICFLWMASLVGGQAAIVHFAPNEPLVPLRGNGVTNVLDLDLDGDGAADFQLINDGTETDVRTLTGNRILGTLGMSQAIRGSAEGAFIGATPSPSAVWTESSFTPSPFGIESRPRIIGCASGGGTTVCFGDFVGTTAFAAVEFQIGGQTHYGWFRVRNGPPLTTDIWIDDWAYESEPGVPILAGAVPEPSVGVLGLLAAMVLGLKRRGRDRRSRSVSRSR